MDASRVLICAPHTDDAELGCGGSMARLLEAGSELHVAAFSRAEESLPVGAPKDLLEAEMRTSLERIGVTSKQISMLNFPVRRFDEHRQEILETMVKIGREFSPTVVLTPASTDVHQDHQVVHAESIRAFRSASIWGYELPWNQVVAHLTGYVVLNERHVDIKVSALDAYESQKLRKRAYFHPEFIRGLARLRGVQAGSDLAEAFEVVRTIVRI